MDEDDMTAEEFRAAMQAGIPATIKHPGRRPVVVVDWPGEAAVWGDETREWAEGVSYDEDPDSNA